MIYNILEISKIGLRSVFTAKKYSKTILEEDLNRILFIRNYIEESLLFVKENYEDVNAEEFYNELKKYARELFLIQCKEAIRDEVKNSENFDLETYQKESADYFNYIYDNLEYHE